MLTGFASCPYFLRPRVLTPSPPLPSTLSSSAQGLGKETGSRLVCPSFLWLRLLLLGLFVLALGTSLPQAVLANPTVPQGGTTTFAQAGTDAPASGLTWDIVLGGATIAKNTDTQGWTVTYYPGGAAQATFTVHAPTGANIATNYEVRYSAGAMPPAPPPAGGAAPQSGGPITGGLGASAFFDVTAAGGGGGGGSVQVSSLTLNPTSVVGGGSSTATVTLSGAAPAGGVTVTLASSNTGVATVPGSLSIGAGLSSGTFTVSTVSVTTATNVTLSAAYGGGNSTAVLSVNPASVGGMTLTLNPTSLFAGQFSTATVTLASPAPQFGAQVSLSSTGNGAIFSNSITIPSGSSSGTFVISTGSTQATPSAPLITATYNSASANATLTINVSKPLPAISSLRCTSLLAPIGAAAGNVRVDWNYTPPTPNVATHFFWTRTYVPPVLNPPTSSNGGGSTTSLYAIDSFAYLVGGHYTYSVQAGPDDLNNLTQGYHYTPGPVSTILVVPEVLPVIDDQAVDARWDLRFSTYTLLDHKFGASTYRGGLYVGNSPDPSRMGRSFFRFGSPNALMDPYNHWYLPAPLSCWTGSLGAYFTGATQTNTTGWTVGAQFVADNGWTSANLCWSAAPTLDPMMPTSTVTVTFDTSNPVFGWYSWSLGNSGMNAALASSTLLTAGLAVTTESADQANQTYSWLYFAKREWNALNAPYLAYAWGSGPTVTLGLSATTIKGGTSLTGTLSCSGLTSPLTVTLATDDAAHVTLPATVTIPTGGSVTFPIGTAAIATAKGIKIVYGYTNYGTLTVTP